MAVREQPGGRQTRRPEDRTARTEPAARHATEAMEEPAGVRTIVEMRVQRPAAQEEDPEKTGPRIPREALAPTGK